MTRMFAMLGVILLTAGCAHGQQTKHTLVMADSAIFELLSGIHATEQTALCGRTSCAGYDGPGPVPGWDLAKSQAFNRQFLPAVEAARQLNSVLKTWKPEEPVPIQIRQLVTSLQAALTAVVIDFPPGASQTAILVGISKAQAIILHTLEIILELKGGA